MSRTTFVFVLATCVLSSTLLRAQTDELQPGVRVRITAPGIVAGRYVGTVLSRSGDTVMVGSPTAQPLAIPSSRIVSLEIRRGKSRGDGALRGIKWGIPIGLALGAVTVGFADCTDCSNDAGQALGWIALNGVSGAIWGAGIGALIGRERWERFDLPRRAAIRVTPGGAMLGMRYDF
jgi:hypothetical protein